MGFKILMLWGKKSIEKTLNLKNKKPLKWRLISAFRSFVGL